MRAFAEFENVSNWHTCWCSRWWVLHSHIYIYLYTPHTHIQWMNGFFPTCRRWYVKPMPFFARVASRIWPALARLYIYPWEFLPLLPSSSNSIIIYVSLHSHWMRCVRRLLAAWPADGISISIGFNLVSHFSLLFCPQIPFFYFPSILHNFVTNCNEISFCCKIQNETSHAYLFADRTNA